MITSNGISFEINLKDNATKQYSKFVGDIKSGNEEVRNSFNQASEVYKENGKQISSLTKWIREDRKEKREHNYLYREGREVIGAASLALTLYGNTMGGASEKSKKLNDSLNAGMVGFTGISSALFMLPGPVGIVAGAIGGLAIAFKRMTDDSEEAAKKLKEFKEIQKNYNQGIGLKEAEKEYKVFAQGVIEAESKIKNLTEQKNAIINKSREESNKYTQGELGSFVIAEKNAQKQIDILNEQIKKEESRRMSWKITAESLNEVIEQEKELARIRKVTEAAEQENKTPEELAKEKLKEDKKYLDDRFAAIKDADAKADQQFAERWNDYKQVLHEMSRMERQMYKGNKDYEMDVLEEWHRKALADAEYFAVEVEQIEKVYRDRKREIENEDLRKKVDEAAKYTQQAISVFQQFDNQRYDHELNALNKEQYAKQKALDKEKNAKIKAINDELKNEHLSSARKKELQEQLSKVNEDYAQKKEKIDEESAQKEAAIKRKQWQANKDYSLAMAVINGAQAVTKAFAEMGPLGFVGAAITTAVTAAQIALIASQEMPEFHEGGTMDWGGNRIPLASDERPAVLKVGETVRTKEQEASLQNGGSVIHFHFNGHVTNEEGLVKVLKSALEKSGFNSVTDLITNDRKGYRLGSVN